jgi:hypothetical protein
MTQAERLDALEALGYAPREAAFLVLAALHSGYFLCRQFRHFARIHDGKATTVFTDKLLTNHHASCQRVAYHTDLFHVGAKRVYAELDEPDNRHRRPRSALAVKTKLMALDYVLAHPADEFLATERERVAYFIERQQLTHQVLPTKTYRGRQTTTRRCFVDKSPIAIARPGVSPLPPTFGYVDPGEATLAGFETYLEQYQPLLQALPSAHVLYIADRRGRWVDAEAVFRRVWKRAGTYQQSWINQLLRYFRARALYERRVAGQITTEALDHVRDGRAAFSSPRVEDLFARWCHDGDASLRAALDAERQQLAVRPITFGTWCADLTTTYLAASGTRRRRRNVSPARHDRERRLHPMRHPMLHAQRPRNPRGRRDSARRPLPTKPVAGVGFGAGATPVIGDAPSIPCGVAPAPDMRGWKNQLQVCARVRERISHRESRVAGERQQSKPVPSILLTRGPSVRPGLAPIDRQISTGDASTDHEKLEAMPFASIPC